MKSVQYPNFTLHIVRGDISRFKGDMVVNAANTWVINGSGVAGAIDGAAGFQLQEQLDKIGHVPTGHSVVTPGYQMDAKWIAHAVAPVWEPRRKSQCMAIVTQLIEDIIAQANTYGAVSLAIPAIGTGVYQWPYTTFLQCFLNALDNVSSRTVTEIYLVVWTREDYYFTVGWLDQDSDDSVHPMFPVKPLTRPTGGIPFKQGSPVNHDYGRGFVEGFRAREEDSEE